MNYPENLYKYRALNGIAMYTRVKDDIYEDTTCKHPGGHCQIRVKQDGDHWDYVECANEVAHEFEYFHKFGPMDSHFHADKISCMIEVNRYWHGECERKIRRFSEDMANAEQELSTMGLADVTPQKIDEIEFDEILVVVPEGTDKPFNDKVENKVFGKDGLKYLITNGNVHVRDAENSERMDGVCTIDEYDGSYEKTYFVFRSQKAYDAYRNNEAYRSLEKKVSGMSAEIERNKRDMQKYAEEIARLTKEKEVKYGS